MKNINVYSLLITLLWFSLFKINVIPNLVRQIVKILVIVFVFIYILRNIKDKKYFSNQFLPFILIVIVSSIFGYYNNYISISSLFDAFLYSMCIYFSSIFIYYGFDNDKGNIIINSLFNVLIIYLFGTIITIIKNGVTDSTYLLKYFAGNKFSTSYCLILFAIIFAIKNDISSKKNKIKYFLLVTLVIFLVYYIRCSTAFVASFLLFLCMFGNNKIRNILVQKKTFLLAIVISTFVLYGLNSLLKIDYIQHIFVNILHENLTLTGRTEIYSKLPYIIGLHPLFGSGYGTNIVAEVVGYGNAQNGIIQLFVQFGVFGLLFFIVSVLKSIDNFDKKKKCYPLYIYIYIMIVSSIVEVSFNYYFFSALFIISAFNDNRFEKIVEV